MATRMSAVTFVLSLTASVIAAPSDTKPQKKNKVTKKIQKDQRKDGRSRKRKPSVKRSSRRSTRNPKNLAVKAMKMVIEDAEFVDMTFEEFTEWLARRTRANVVVRWNVLKELGIERDHAIALKRRDIAVRELLVLVFRQVTEALPAVELAAKADGNILMISTRKDINAKRMTRVYDIKNLLISIPHFTGSKIEDIDIGDNDNFRIRNPRLKEKGRTPNAEAQHLIDLITRHVEPLSWKINGGKGTIRYYKGRLVVYNSLEVHQQLGGVVVRASGAETRG